MLVTRATALVPLLAILQAGPGPATHDAPFQKRSWVGEVEPNVLEKSRSVVTKNSSVITCAAKFSSHAPFGSGTEDNSSIDVLAKI